MNDQPSILIVDDDEGIRRTLTMILAKKNYQPLTAPDGKTALALMEEHFFNLALLDLRLPDSSGTDLLAQLKSRYPDLEALILTGHASLETAIQALSLGAYHYFIKPINVDDLLFTLDKALDKQRLVIENRRLLEQAQKVLAERVRAEEARRESETRYENLIETMTEGLATTNAQGEITFINDTLSRMTGYAFSELLGQSHLTIVAEENRQLNTDEMAQRRNGKSNTFETRLRRKDGTTVPVILSGKPVFDQNGQFAGTLAVITDITERFHVEEALRASEEKFRTFFEQTAEGISITDETGAIIEWNTAAEQITSLTRQEVIGKPVWDVLAKIASPGKHTPETRPAIIASIREALRTGQSPFFNRPNLTIVNRPNGEQRYIEQSFFPISTAHGFWLGATTRDITARRQREREIQAVATVSTVLRTAFTRAEMLPVILDQVQTLLNAQAAILTTRDPATNDTVVELARGAWADATGRRIPSGQGVSARVFQTGQPYVTNDLPNEPLFYIRDLIGDLRALAIVPLIVQGHPIGSLALGRLTPITREELETLTTIADIAGNALHRAALHEKTEQQLQYLVALQTVDRAINASLDLRFTLNILLDQIVSQLRVDAAAILLHNPASQTLEYAAGRGFRTKGIERRAWQIGEGYAGAVARAGHSVTIRNLAQSSDRESTAAFAGEDFVSYCGVPLIAKGKIKGVLQVLQRSPLRADAEWLNFFEMLAGQAAIAVDNAQLFEELQRAHSHLVLSYDATIEGWSRALDLRDQETEGHAQRVAALTEQLARAVGVGEADLVHIHRGALLHDIGKIGVPDRILRKPSALTDEEWAIMRRHPEFALDLLKPIPYLHAALDIPYCHHEKWDGTGYPRGLQDETIPLAARIFALVDVWDALRSERPYRPALSKDKAREYLRRQAGKHFDPRLTEHFLQIAR